MQQLFRSLLRIALIWKQQMRVFGSIFESKIYFLYIYIQTKHKKLYRFLCFLTWTFLLIFVLHLAVHAMVNLVKMVSHMDNLVSMDSHMNQQLLLMYPDMGALPRIPELESYHLMMRPPAPDPTQGRVDLDLRISLPGSSSAAGAQPNPALPNMGMGEDLELRQPLITEEHFLTSTEKSIFHDLRLQAIGKNVDRTALIERAKQIVAAKRAILDRVNELDPSPFWQTHKEELITKTIYPPSGEHTQQTLQRYLAELHGPDAYNTTLFKRLHQVRIDSEVFGLPITWFKNE